MNPDPTNFCPNFVEQSEKAREVIYSETEKVAPLMANAHMKIRDFTPTGDHKHANVKRILDIYQKNGYDGHVVLEYFGQDDPAQPNRQGVELLRRLMG
jgi:hypothetical protein